MTTSAITNGVAINGAEVFELLRDDLAADLVGLGWAVVPGCANFLLCKLPAHQPTASALVTACRERNLFVRDVSNMGRCFDDHTLRVAVKDATTNSAMVRILEATLAGMTPTRMIIAA